jgi:hypothetical protein
MAAATARLDVFPDRPREGERATLQLRTFWTYPDRTPPAIFEADYPMVVAAFAPNGRRVEIRLVRDRDDPCPVGRGRGAVPTSASEREPEPPRIHGHRVGSGACVPGLGPDRPVLDYLDPIPSQSLFSGSIWFGNKVLWAVDRASYRGPILIRGRQLEVRTGFGSRPAPYQRPSSDCVPPASAIPRSRAFAPLGATRTRLTAWASATRSSSRRDPPDARGYSRIRREHSH